MYSENRTSERIPKSNRVTLTPYSAVHPTVLLTPVPATLVDVSREGICVKSDTELLPTIRVRIRIELGGTHLASASESRFECDAEIMWSKPLHEEGPHQEGLYLLNPSKADLQKWLEFISKSRSSLY